MKNRKLSIILIAVFLCAAIVLAGLWMAEKKDHSELEDLCRYSARRAYERFSTYLDSGHPYDYDYGVAELVSFYNSYMNLVTRETGSTDPNCIYLNQLLGALMDKPELTPEQAGELAVICDMLNEDIYDINAYHRIFSLYNELVY